MEKSKLDFIQDQIGGYEFKNKDLLQQAFVRSSYSEENGGQDNEVLEFIGDKVLDFVTVKVLIDQYGSMTEDYDDYNRYEDFNEFYCDYDEGKLTKIKQKIICQSNLAKQIDRLGIAGYLLLGEGDYKNNVGEKESVKSDLFEAILGAVALDCNWNISELEEIVSIMINFGEILNKEDELNYIQCIEDWVRKDSGRVPKYHCQRYHWGVPSVVPANRRKRLITTQRIMNNPNGTCYECLLEISEEDDIPDFRAYGNSKKEARIAVCELAYEYLEKNDMLNDSIQYEIDNPNLNESINQLEILVRRGYFKLPKYEFEEEYDKNGNPIWKCKCIIKDIGKTYIGKASSKKDAKIQSAFKMLKKVLDN